MREIKFRAWDIFDKVMVYGNEHNGNDIWDGVRASSVQLVNDRFEEYRYAWMQFTGLTDRKKIDVYEGDILKTDFCNMVVVYEAPMYLLKNGMARISLDESYKFEIIGNIYEHPHLLEGVK